jgi:hypothetical protein
MKTLNYLIVELDEAYNNEVKVDSDKSVIVNSTIEDVSYVNRVATVVAAPSFTILKAGDKVVVHHNIFRLRNDVKGNVAPSNFFIEDNKYFVPLTEIFMYKRDSDWIALAPFCFVEPIEIQKDKVNFEITNEEAYKGRLDRKGILRYLNSDMEAQGMREGDKVLFSRNSEYEFNIDDKLYYKMSTKDILGVI